jgi:acyl-CoA thioester hydrolase
MLANETLISHRPVIVRRVVQWGECDPAGVVYTPRFCDYAVSAYQYFLGEIFGRPMHKRMHDQDLGLPMKAMSYEFHASLWPEESFDMAVSVLALRSRSFDLRVEAAHQRGHRVFTANLSPICVHANARVSTAIPDFLREWLLTYQAETVA